MLNKRTAIHLLFIIMATILLTGCASVPIYNLAKSGQIGIFNPVGLLIGVVLMYYTWVEAKKKNRNALGWLTLTFLFGLIPAVILIIYLKDLPQERTEN